MKKWQGGFKSVWPMQWLSYRCNHPTPNLLKEPV